MFLRNANRRKRCNNGSTEMSYTSNQFYFKIIFFPTHLAGRVILYNTHEILFRWRLRRKKTGAPYADIYQFMFFFHVDFAGQTLLEKH